MKKALQSAGLRAAVSVPESAVVAAGRQTERNRSFHPFSELHVGDPRGQRGGLTDGLLRDLGDGFPSSSRRRRSRLGQVALREPQCLRSDIAELATQALRDVRRELAELERPYGRRRIDVKRPVPRHARRPRIARDLDPDDPRPGGDDPRHRPMPIEARELTLDRFADPPHQPALPSGTATTWTGPAGSAWAQAA